jgi:PadR family transcriptional regulator
MRTKPGLGEFEQVVLLAIMQLKADAYGPEIARLLESVANRDVSRGALYSSLDRLERKGMLTWRIPGANAEERAQPMRLFSVTKLGIDTLREQRSVLLTLWSGLEATLAPKARR